MVAINPAFVDVDFSKQPLFVMGDLGPQPAEAKRFAKYEDNAQVHPESQWKELADAIAKDGGGCSRLVTRIYNQKNEGSCVANACSQAMEIIMAKQFGKKNVVPLSAISLYKRIGRSPGSGAMVSDGLDELAERGILPLDTPENRAKYGNHVMPATGFYEKYPDDWETTAALIRGLEWNICQSVAELISALINQDPVVVGRSGHSICYCDPIYSGSALNVLYANSWNGWGQGGGDFDTGFGVDSMGSIRSSAGWAFALRSVTDYRK